MNQEGARGLVRMQMLEAVEIVGDTVYFKLPTALRSAVLFSRDYAWIDINAIPRFTSKFTASVYMKACYEAGKHRTRRKNVVESLDAFRARMNLPEGTKANVLADVIGRVKDDLLAIDGPRRRFDLKFVVESGENGVVRIEVGSAAKKLKELKPQGLSGPARLQLERNNSGPLSIPAARYPSIVRIRQAATLLETAALHVSDAWILEVFGAMKSDGQTVVGLRGPDFLGLIDKYGADEVFEFWLDKQSVIRSSRKIEDIGVPVYRVKAEAIETKVVEAEVVIEDDISMGDDYGDLEYGDLDIEPPAMFEADDSNDDDIDF
jgi:hypothetical protein